MQDLTTRFNQYLKGKRELQGEILEDQMGEDDALLYAAQLRGCILDAAVQAGIPFEVSSSVGSVELVGNHIEIEVNLDHESAKRESFSPDSRGYADLLYLFNNGWNFTSKPPVGFYGGKRTVAWKKRSATGFVQNAAYAFKSEVPDNVTVEYDPAYDG